jgi:hypothetical protein
MTQLERHWGANALHRPVCRLGLDITLIPRSQICSSGWQIHVQEIHKTSEGGFSGLPARTTYPSICRRFFELDGCIAMCSVGPRRAVARWRVGGGGGCAGAGWWLARLARAYRSACVVAVSGGRGGSAKCGSGAAYRDAVSGGLRDRTCLKSRHAPRRLARVSGLGRRPGAGLRWPACGGRCCRG